MSTFLCRLRCCLTAMLVAALWVGAVAPSFAGGGSNSGNGNSGSSNSGSSNSGGSNSGSGSSGGGNSSGSGSSDSDMPGEILVKLRSGDALQPLLAKYSLSLVDRFGARPIYRLKVIGSARVQDILPGLLREPAVMIAETNTTHRSPEARRNQPWVIGNPVGYATQWAPQAMRLAQAHTLTRGAGMRIAVLDTGVDATHPLLAGRLLPGFDFVDGDNDPREVPAQGNSGPSSAYGHGTHVAGLVAMVAPDAKIMPLRILDSDGVGNAWVLAEALLHAIDPDGNPATDDGAHVINLSLGSLTRTRLMDTIAQIASCTAALANDPVGDRSDPGYAADVLRCGRGRSAVVVAAAGNGSSSNVKEYPAAEGEGGLLAVGASTAAGRLAGFSNSGSWVQLLAPGDGITSAVPGGYGTWSGTSMAAPLAAGTVALVRSLNLNLSPKDVVERLKRSAAVLCGVQLKQVDAWAAVRNQSSSSNGCN